MGQRLPVVKLLQGFNHDRADLEELNSLVTVSLLLHKVVLFGDKVVYYSGEESS